MSNPSKNRCSDDSQPGFSQAKKYYAAAEKGRNQNKEKQKQKQTLLQRREFGRKSYCVTAANVYNNMPILARQLDFRVLFRTYVNDLI